MINQCVLTGRLNNFYISDDSLVLMLIHSNNDGDMVMPVYTNFKPEQVLIDYLKEDLLIGIKGYVTLDKNSCVTIMAEKLTFIPHKEKDGECYE